MRVQKTDMAGRIKSFVKDPYRLFGLVMILFVILCYNVLIIHNGFRFFNSDDSSELVLARILASEHSILTKDWYYSSELRVFNTNLVFAPMFYLFSSWSLVRAAAGTIMMILYVLSYLFIPYAWKYDARWFYLTAFILIMPYANPWQFFGLKMYYIPHVFITFAAFGLLGIVYRGKRKKTAAVVLAIFAFVAGLGGARSVEFTFVPLLLAALAAFIFDKGSGVLAAVSGVSAFTSAAGYLVNDTVLSGIYTFHSYDDVSFIRFMLEKVEWTLDSILTAFGYVVGEYFISLGGVCNALAFAMMVLFLLSFILLLLKRSEMDEVQRYMYYFATIIFWLNTFLMVLGQNDEYADRYIAIGMVPCIMFIDLLYKLCLKNVEWQKYAGMAVIAFFLLVGAKGYLDLLNVSANGERMGYINFVKEQGYDYGYATFWNANITTEMSDGEINMTSLDPNADKLEVFRWLTDKRLIDGEHEKAFLVLTNEELDMYKGKTPIYSDEYFCVFDIDKSEISFEEQGAI